MGLLCNVGGHAAPKPTVPDTKNLHRDPLDNG
jgi:hypothetical protein